MAERSQFDHDRVLAHKFPEVLFSLCDVKLILLGCLSFNISIFSSFLLLHIDAVNVRLYRKVDHL